MGGKVRGGEEVDGAKRREGREQKGWYGLNPADNTWKQ